MGFWWYIWICSELIKRGFKESPKELAIIFKNRKDYYTNMDMIENSYLK